MNNTNRWKDLEIFYKAFVEDESVSRSLRAITEPITLEKCLEAFTHDEELGEKYQCSACQQMQPAAKKLQIWKFPPVLVDIQENELK